jgi:hypothetical protein
MPNPDDIKIRMTTEADTSGAEEMKDALQDVTTEVKDFEKAAETVDDSLGKIEARTKAFALAQVSQEIAGLGGRLKDLAKDLGPGGVGGAVEDIGAGLETTGGILSSLAQGFAAAGPWGAIVAGAVSGLEQVTKFAGKVEKEVDAADAASLRALDLAKQYRALEARIGIEEVTSEYRKQLVLLTEQETVLNRINKVRAAQGSAAVQGAQADADIAETTGGDVVGTKGQVLIEKTFNQYDAVAAAISEGEAAVASAANELAVARSQLNEEITQFGFPSDQSSAAEKAVTEKEAQLAQSQAALDDIRRIAAAQTEAIKKQADASFAELAAGVQENNEAAVEGLVDQVGKATSQLVERTGGALTADAAGAIDRLQQIAQDAIPDSQQIDQIIQSVQQLRGSQSVLLSGLQPNFDAMLQNQRTTSAILTQQAQQIAQVQQQLASLQGQVGAQ